MDDDWNRLKKWLDEEVKERNETRFVGFDYSSIGFRVVQNKIKEIENERYCQSLTEAGY